MVVKVKEVKKTRRHDFGLILQQDLNKSVSPCVVCDLPSWVSEPGGKQSRSSRQQSRLDFKFTRCRSMGGKRKPPERPEGRWCCRETLWDERKKNGTKQLMYEQPKGRGMLWTVPSGRLEKNFPASKMKTFLLTSLSVEVGYQLQLGLKSKFLIIN